MTEVALASRREPARCEVP